MNFAAIFMLAVGLAMDATAVAAGRGLAAARITGRDVLCVAGLFGGFQALMPAVGWGIGRKFGSAIQAWDHWIAFTLLFAIGAKMIWEARGGPDEKDAHIVTRDVFGIRVLLVLALATSIDALAVGFTLPLLSAPFMLSLATIGVVTALLSAIGVLAGQRFGKVLGPRLELFGGLLLVALGIKILVEHLHQA